MAKKKMSFADMIETAKKAPKNQQLGGIICVVMAVVLFVFWIVQFFM